MQKRGVTLGGYDTAANDWTLTSWTLSPAAEKTNFVEKRGGDGSWDLSTALTDGIPTFSDRDLTITLELSAGTRQARNEEITRLANLLHGMRVGITPPDDIYHHLRGKVYITKEYSNEAHAAVTVTAICEPWLYANEDTAVTLAVTSTAKTAMLINNGRRAVVPTLTVTGTSVRVAYGDKALALSAGQYQWPELLLTPGRHEITYSGSGTLAVTYREAVLE